MNLKKTVNGGKTLLKNWWNDVVESNFLTIQNAFNTHEEETERAAATLADIKAGKATITGTEKKGTVQLVSAGNSMTSDDIMTITFECGKTANAYVGGQVWIESISGQWLDGKDIVFSDETFDIKSVAEGLVSLYVYVKSISADNEVTMGLGIIDLLHDPISPVLPDGEGGETGETDLQNFFRLTDEQIIIGEGKDCKPHTYTKETIYRAKQIAISDGDGTVRFFDIEQTAIIPALEVKKQLSEELYNKINALASEDANLSEKITTETTARETADNSLIKQINEKIGFESSEYIKAWGEVIDWDSQLEPKIYSISNETHIPSGLPSENGQGLIFVYKTDEELLPVSDPNTQKAYVQCTFSQMYISGRNVYYRKTGSHYELDSNSDIIDDSPNGTDPQWSEWQKIVPNVGDLSDLATTDKTSIVGAVNEVNSLKTDKTEIGNLADLTTIEQGSIVDAINELDSSMELIKTIRLEEDNVQCIDVLTSDEGIYLDEFICVVSGLFNVSGTEIIAIRSNNGGSYWHYVSTSYSDTDITNSQYKSVFSYGKKVLGNIFLSLRTDAVTGVKYNSDGNISSQGISSSTSTVKGCIVADNYNLIEKGVNNLQVLTIDNSASTFAAGTIVRLYGKKVRVTQ